MHVRPARCAGLLLLLLAAAATAASIPHVTVPEDSLFATVYCTPQAACTFGQAPTNASLPAAQIAVNNNGEHVNGWDAVIVRAVLDSSNSAPALPLATVAYAMGYAEGFATNQRIYQQYVNQQIAGQRQNFSTHVADWITSHLVYMRATAAAQGASDPYWAEVGRLLRQVDGMADGFNDAAGIYNLQLETMDIFLISFLFEIYDVVLAMERLHGSLSKMTPFQKTFYKGFTTHCSALIKPIPASTPGGADDDVLVTHTTWGTLDSMLRQYKIYQLGNYTVAFSSYPGTLHSGDDIYALSSGFAIMETTNENYNNATAPYVTPRSVSEFIRVMVANKLATSGAVWGTLFCQENSGTYNNQWMVVDLSAIAAAGTPLSFASPGSLQIIEQMPNLCLSRDQSNFTNDQTYWSSFNRPFYPEMYQWAGTAAMYELHGDYFSYYQNYRRLIFARNQSSVVDVASMQALIRYNDYLNDPLSIVPYKAGNNCSGYPVRNPETSISARSDLTPFNSTWCDLTFDIGAQNMAGIDGKIISLRSVLAKGLGMWLVNGPMSGGASQIPVFQWSTSLYNTVVPHIGMPNLFNFSWVDGAGDVVASVTAAPRAYVDDNVTLTVVYNVPVASFGVGFAFATAVTQLVASQVAPLLEAPSSSYPLPLPPRYARGTQAVPAAELTLKDGSAVVVESATYFSDSACLVTFAFDGSAKAVRDTNIFLQTLPEELAAYGMALPPPPTPATLGTTNQRNVGIAIGCSLGFVVLLAAAIVVKGKVSKEEASSNTYVKL